MQKEMTPVETNTILEQDGSGLFALPWEVKERIYEHYLTFGREDFGSTSRPLLTFFEQGVYTKPLPSFMLTCKRAYRELQQRVHADAVMHVHPQALGDRGIGFAVHGTLRFERLRRFYLLLTTEYPNWNRWMGVFGEVTQRSKDLTELVIDWEPRPTFQNLKGWEAKFNEKKSSEFFGILSQLHHLEVVRFHGDLPVGWRERFEKETTARLVCYKFKWWKEHGLE
ncbi:hypothetical protein LY78DRAFT_662181 [Colletotrichum sublineola]|uniref:Uncharacterized protein n=1 Tax=Colletotrichum sublineola TaxID=1173701 RepID=A0A066XJP7_COLSU|nr:hypothetical protein LY78DRAFT_662181 [Colletotrichum sublineola]KDN69428.1 hypothetical protein CSUB01_05345 [Colletotrichum sublineola]